MMVFLSILVSALTGFLLVRALWPGSMRWESADWFRLPLGVWCGLGLSSVASFAVQLASPGNRTMWIGADVALLVVAAAVWAMLGRGTSLATDEAPAWSFAKWFGLATAAVTAVSFGIMALLRQTGDVDAWTIWNLKARFLYRGATFATLADPLLTWSHPELPYLLSASVLRTWHWAAEETMMGPTLLAATFVSSLAMAVFGAVRLLRSKSQAFLALAAVAGSTGFIGTGAVQYADFPLTAFLFGSIASIYLAERLGLPRLCLAAGLCAGFASWTKFEGAFYLVALVGLAIWRLGAGGAVPMIAGVIPGAAMLAYFKATIAPSVPGISADPVNLLIAISSKLIIFQFLGWVVSPFLVFALYLYCVGVSKDRRHGWYTLAALFVAGCIAIIVRDDNSGDTASIRILLHVWPIALLAAFLHANSPEELAMSTGGKAHKKASSSRK